MGIREKYTAIDDKWGMPEPIDVFVEWLGVYSLAAAEAMNFEELSNLPGIKGRSLYPLGGFPKAVPSGDNPFMGVHFDWGVSDDEAECFTLGERFGGDGACYKSAALDGLFCAWEYWIRRRSMHGGGNNGA